MFDRFSEDARTLMSAARKAAQELGHDYIGTEHMLLGIIASDRTVAATTLRKLRVDADRVRTEVAKIVRSGTSEVIGQRPFTPRAKRVVELSIDEATEQGNRHIGTGHLLLGLIREEQGRAAQVLNRLGVNLDKARPVVMEVMRTTTDPRDEPPLNSILCGDPLKKVLAAASAEAGRGQPVVEPEHVLVALLDGDGIAARILRELGATPEGVRKRVQELRGS